MRDQARVVVIGGGIFGASVAYHLTQAGCTDIVLVDKGELTSGTTFHSVGLVSQFRTSPALMRIMNYTIALFNEFKADIGDSLGWHTVGSLRLASSKDRLKALAREVSRAKAIGIEAEIISAAEALKLVPHISPKDLYGAVYVPDDGHIDPSSITYELARRAKAAGADVQTRVRVTGIDVNPKGEVVRVRTDKGDINTECVVNAAGQWAPRVGEMVGVHIPIVPLMHQYLTTKPIPGHELPRDTPVVRDPDKLFYLREDVGAFLLGAFESNPKPWSADGVPWQFTQELLPPEWELFEPVMEMAIERVPLLAEAEIIELINGPDGFTPDGHYALGPVPGLHGFYLAAGGSINGIAGAGGVGKLIAEWILEGAPSIDTHEMNVRRFGPHLKHPGYLTESCREVYRYYYRMHYPNDERKWGRPFRTSPFYSRLKDAGAVFGHKNGWERTNYFEPDHPWRQAGADQKKWGWQRPAFYDAVAREVQAARQGAAIIDMTSFGKADLKGPGALDLLQRLAVSNIDKPIGSVVYTQFLNPAGGIEADVTVTRLGQNRFRVISGTGFAASDFGWMQMHLPQDGSVALADVTEELGCLALCGPASRQVLSAATTDDVSNAAFAYMTGRMITVADTPVWAQRISYAGELGWELYIPWEMSPAVWDALITAGRPFEQTPIGYKALDSLRIERGFLYWSSDITPDDTPLEAGLAFRIDWDKGDFIGREALIKKQAAGSDTRLCAVTLDAGHCLFGGESVAVDGRTVARIRSAAFGHTLECDIGLVYLPLKWAVAKTEVSVSVMGKWIDAKVRLLPLLKPAGGRKSSTLDSC